MSKTEVLPYFARGFNNKTAIKYLLESEGLGIDKALAVNPYLSTEDLGTLIARSHRRYPTDILLASRVDLTETHALEIVNSGDEVAIISLLTTGKLNKPKLSDLVIKQLLENNSRSDASYYDKILAATQEGSPYQYKILKRKINTTPTTASKWDTRKMALFAARALKDAYFLEYVNLVKSGQPRSPKTYQGGTLNPLQCSIAALTLTGGMAINIPSAVTCEYISGLAPDAGAEFFSVLFGILPEWGSTLQDALTTALSLTSSR